MISNQKLKRVKYSPLIVFVAVLITLITVMCLMIFVPKSYSVQYDIVYDGISTEGLIVRDEAFFDLQGYEKIQYNNVVEGQFVNHNTDIALAYKKGYIKNTLSKLIETEKNIVVQLNTLTAGYDDKIIHQYDFEIKVVIQNMSNAVDGFIEHYSKLCSLMNERAQYIRDNYTPDQMLEDLYNDEKNLIESIESWRDHIKSNNDGFIGFYCDGFETQFNSSNILDVNYSDFNNALKKGLNNDLKGFKIVSDQKWYVIVEIDDAKDYQVGNHYQIYIANEPDCEYGYLEKIIEEKKGSALVFSFSDNVEKYLDLRITKIFIGSRYEGYSVKNKFIDDSTVIVKNDKQKTRVSVEIIYSDKDKTVFKCSEQISLGQKVYNK